MNRRARPEGGRPKAYTCTANSDKLFQVHDEYNDTASVLGDFHYKGAKADSDYRYDGNGNLTIDNNKGIDSIYYNYLNLPQQVHMKGKGNIFYTYDAAGNKLQKQVLDSLSGLATTTSYMIAGIQFQRRTPISNPSGGTDTLQFLGHEEGRVRWAFLTHLAGDTAHGWEYDFFERDHLGNTRIVLTQERDTAQYIATMEPQYRATENALFYNIDSTSYAASAVPHGGFPTEPKGPTPNDSVAKVDGAGHEIGPAILLKVQSGDSIAIGCYGYYASGGTVSPPNSSFTSVLSSLATGLFSLTAGTHGTTLAMTNPSNGPVYLGASSFLSSRDTNTTVAPKAYLNWILLDNQLNYVSGNNQSGAAYIGQPNILNTLATGIRLNHSGFLYIWVSNETPNWPVFFDNLSVEHFSGPLLEENHYYPFGLGMAGISDKALKTNYAENKYRYSDKELQNKEFSDGSGLEEYDFGARNYDQQIGRFSTQDRFADHYHSLTPYQYTANSPTNFVDQNGDYITIDKKDDNGNLMLSLLYDGGKAYFYSKDKDGNITKGDAWDGNDGFIEQTVNDLNDVSSTKQGGIVVGDLEGSKYGYNISEASGIPETGFQSDDGAKGGGSIAYTQKGGTINWVSATSAVVLGHELYHGWASEFTNESKGSDFGTRLKRETGAVKFENYLRANFGEKDMRTDYTLEKKYRTCCKLKCRRS